MTRRDRLSDRLTVTPGSRRTITGDEFADMRHQAAELEADNEALRAGLERRGTAQLTVSEAPVYGPASRFSWFRDAAAVAIHGAHIERDGGRAGAEKRLHQHAAYEHHRTERRLLAARHRAESLTEAAITSTRQEAVLYERWRRAGGQLFEYKHELDGMELETRALNRTQGDGGYFGPPGWLVDRFVHAPRAGAPFAALWTQLDLPRGITSVNLPTFSAGAESGAVEDGAAVPSHAPVDGTVKANLITISAQVDMSVQWLDQTPVPPDESLGADLAEDFMIQLDGQLLLGAGSPGQAQGAIDGGVFSASNLIWLSNTSNDTVGWADGGTGYPLDGSVHQFTAQLYSKIARYRGLPPTSYLMNPQAWAIASGSGDRAGRPLSPPGPQYPGAVPTLHGLPVTLDQNLPNTFGGATPPTIGVSAGVTSPTDGNGTWTPILAGRWADLIYWQSEPDVRVLSEVLAGTLQARFQVRCYLAAIPNRIQWAGGSVSFSAYSQAGGVNTGAAVAYGGLTQYTTNSVLQPAASGY